MLTARDQRLRRVYRGLTEEQWVKMWLLKDRRCWICGTPGHKGPSNKKRRRLYTEHDHHAPYKVRGLACRYCNKFLIGRHTAETAKKISDYLASGFDGRTL